MRTSRCASPSQCLASPSKCGAPQVLLRKKENLSCVTTNSTKAFRPTLFVALRQVTKHCQAGGLGMPNNLNCTRKSANQVVLCNFSTVQSVRDFVTTSTDSTMHVMFGLKCHKQSNTLACIVLCAQSGGVALKSYHHCEHFKGCNFTCRPLTEKTLRHPCGQTRKAHTKRLRLTWHLDKTTPRG